MTTVPVWPILGRTDRPLGRGLALQRQGSDTGCNVPLPALETYMMPCLLTTSLASWVKRPWLGVEVACRRHTEALVYMVNVLSMLFCSSQDAVKLHHQRKHAP